MRREKAVFGSKVQEIGLYFKGGDCRSNLGRPGGLGGPGKSKSLGCTKCVKRKPMRAQKFRPTILV